MIDLRLRLVAVVAALGGCASAEKAPPAADPPRGSAVGSGAASGSAVGSGVGSGAAAAGCQGKPTVGDVLTFRETTNNALSKQDVGISNIFERDLPDAQGVTAKRMSAVLVIHDPATDAIKRETVFAGSEVDVGGERYCVVTVALGSGAPGTVALVKLGR